MLLRLNKSMKKKRLDEILIKKEMVKTKEEAFIVVTEGRIFVEGQKAISPAQPVDENARIEMRQGREFVGRGALKLKAALEAFNVPLKGKTCLDVGAATGGFTQVLLKNGAGKVYALDTAFGKLDPKLREDPRVIVMENTDIRQAQGSLPDHFDCITIDVSLIPLEEILPHLHEFLKPEGYVIALFKPQYQTRDPKILEHGVIKDDRERQILLDNFFKWCKENSWTVEDYIESPVQGSKGNVEYLLLLIPN